MNLQPHRFETREQLFAELVDLFAGALALAIQQRGEATMLLSGGSTPAPVYESLAQKDLDWERVNVALVDERWVSIDHESSNEAMLRRVLLDNGARDVHLTGMKNEAPTPESGLAECERRYAALHKPYDLCLLGMGPDGHTASLFPRAHGLEDAIQGESHCAAIEAKPSAVTGSNLQRMTMTPWSLLQSRRLILLITGNEKWQVLERACEIGRSTELPISLFIHQSTIPLEVYWAP